MNMTETFEISFFFFRDITARLTMETVVRRLLFLYSPAKFTYLTLIFGRADDLFF